MTSILSQQKWVFNASNSNAIICKSKNICSVFLSISAICKNFWILRKKRGASEVICFWNYRLQKAGLLKLLKSPLREHLWIVNILKRPKDCLNKSAGHLFCNVFWSLLNEISSENSVLVVSEILRLFVNILTPDEKYSLSVKASV